MSTITTTPTGPRSGTTAPTPARLRGGPRRRSVPHLLLGVLLVTSCTTGAVVWSLNVGERRVALALARPVALGDTLEAADLREVSVAIDADVDAIPAEEAPSVVGRTVAASLPAGVLLPRGALGTAPIPAAGHAVAALALAPGQVPPGVHAGASVLVVVSADPTTTTSTQQPTQQPARPAPVWPAVVTSVAPRTSGQGFVVSVELAEDDARRVAALPVGQLSVVLVAGGER